MREIVNLTPHVVRVRRPDDALVEYLPSGQIARVRAVYVGPDEDGVFGVEFGEVVGLPDPSRVCACGTTARSGETCPGCGDGYGLGEPVLYVISALAAQAARRADVVSPATGHPQAERDAGGMPFAVPGFVRG